MDLGRFPQNSIPVKSQVIAVIGRRVMKKFGHSPEAKIEVD